MTSKDHLKLELMKYGIEHDFFGYGSQCYKRKDGKYVAIVDGERFVYTGKELADQFDTLVRDDQHDIAECYIEYEIRGTR